MTAAMATRVALREADDSILARQLAAGQPQALEDLIGRYQRRVARLAQRLLAWDGDVDDVVQDVFLTALEKSGRFRGDSSLWTWLTIITLNQCRSRLRRRKLLARLPFRLSRREPHPPADQISLQEETGERVRAAVAALKPRERELIVLHYLEHRPTAELAELLGISRNTLEVRLYRARQRLKMALADLAKG